MTAAATEGRSSESARVTLATFVPPDSRNPAMAAITAEITYSTTRTCQAARA